ncbi:MAG TPA: D-arabinono-1,4-lactone oxidase [Pseudonocardiaceae bacterium]|nr:D-arabinono-1,4-lactone oxidase [Pseudonocardiaceae bacterium]
MTQTWHNWARTAQCRPRSVRRPRSEEELLAAVRDAARAGHRLRVAGSGHSFTPLACTDGVLVDLAGYDRLLAADRDSGLVTVQAGMTLARLNKLLAAHGLAMPNLGDIAYQSVAGAIATGTHGTGIRLGNLSTVVESLRLVTGDGAVLDCSATANADVFGPARIGLGALGAVSTVTLRTVPAFTLAAVEEALRLDDVLGRLDELVDGNDHFEFFWFPGTGHVLAKRNNRTAEPARPRGRISAWANDIVLSNVVLDVACRAARGWSPAARVIHEVAPRLGRTEYSDASDRVFASPRLVRFTELEYAVPREAFAEAFGRLRRLAEAFGPRAFFPWECRFVAGDDIALSPAYGRDSAYLAVQLYQGIPYERFYRQVECVLDEFGGRPHWGKLHFQTCETLRGRYPRWPQFQAARRRVDPDGLFTNDHLARVLG